MKYKINLGGRTLIVDVPHPPRYDLIGAVKVTPTPRQTAKRAPQPVIVITSDGVTTTATRRIGKTIQATATAKCNPGDTFDFDEGARIAFERLCGRDPFPEKPERTEKPETYNGRMLCVESPFAWWTVGKIYDVVNGRITADDGDVYPPRRQAPYRDAVDARHAGAARFSEGDPRHNRRNLFLPVDAEGRLLV